MKAIVRDRYGSTDVLKLEDIDQPTPGDHEVLVKVRAASINTADIDQLTGSPRAGRLFTGIRHPRSRRLGLDMAGEVEAVGAGVSRFAPGDAVWADMFPSGMGAFAEYVCAPEKAFHRKPDGLSFERAAAVPHSGLLALQALGARGGVRSGDRVLINGAGGCVGPFAVQIAKARGAVVTGVDQGDKLDMVLSLGADRVIDYTREDFAKRGIRYDFILDIAARRTLLTHWRALEPGGTYVQVSRTLGGFMRAAIFGGMVGLGSGRSMGVFRWEPNRKEDLDRLAGMIARGEVTPLVDRQYSLEGVAEAMRRQGEGRARGKLIITP